MTHTATVPTQIPRSPWWGCARLFGLLLLLQFGVTLNTAAAGCHSLTVSTKVVFEGSEAGRFAANNIWSHGPVIRVYQDGQFVYYEAPLHSEHGVPCDGPGCREKKPSDSLKPAVNTPNEPSTKNFGHRGGTFADQRPPSGWVANASSSYPSPFSGVPLKPPRSK
ncbi:MAG: hypothetical protein AB8B50_21450 [Pirellulaceae bacterium]